MLFCNKDLTLKLKASSQRIIPQLASISQFDRLCSLLEHLPVFVASGLIEIHLDNSVSQIDLSVKVSSLRSDLNWTGIQRVSSTVDSSEINFCDQLLGEVAMGVIWRKINHLKLKMEDCGRINAKIYLGFGHQWISRKLLNRS